jgi:hypothetical protein
MDADPVIPFPAIAPVSLTNKLQLVHFTTHKKNSPDAESSYILIHVFAGGVSYAGITPSNDTNVAYIIDTKKATLHPVAKQNKKAVSMSTKNYLPKDPNRLRHLVPRFWLFYLE